jgi:ornithine carbamoyltransferase
MIFNLRNRSLLSVQDYTQQEFKCLLDLARDLKRARFARPGQEHLKPENRIMHTIKALRVATLGD